MEPAKKRLPNYMSQKAVTQAKSSEVTWNRAFWGHFDIPQENIFISGMAKYFVLLENVRQNAVTLPEKEKKLFFLIVFSQNFHPEKKSWHFSSLFQSGMKTNIEMSGFAAGWILPNFWCNALAPEFTFYFEVWVDAQRVEGILQKSVCP